MCSGYFFPVLSLPTLIFSTLHSGRGENNQSKLNLIGKIKIALLGIIIIEGYTMILLTWAINTYSTVIVIFFYNTIILYKNFMQLAKLFDEI